jgi:thioredoxin 1
MDQQEQCPFSDVNHLRELYNNNSRKTCIIKFTAKWCNPCKIIAPHYLALANEYPDYDFYEVDIDKNKDLAKLEQIKSLPTFLFYHDGELLTDLTITGTNVDALLTSFELLQSLNDKIIVDDVVGAVVGNEVGDDAITDEVSDEVTDTMDVDESSVGIVDLNEVNF